MAKSNWATLAWDDTGKPLDEFEVDGVIFEPYKNWVYVRDPMAWDEGSGFTGNVVMKFNGGNLRYKNISMIGLHIGYKPQNAFFFYAQTGYDYYDKEKYTENPHPRRWFAGVCSYAYNGGIWVGVKIETFNKYINWLRNYKYEGAISSLGNEQVDFIESLYDGKAVNQGSMYLLGELTDMSKDDMIEQVKNEKSSVLGRALGYEG